MTYPVPSETAGFSMGIQLAKGTAATAYITGRMQQSRLKPRFDEGDTTPEHTGSDRRPTDLQTPPFNTGYVMTVDGKWKLYPAMIGTALLMSGYEVTSEAKGTVTVAEATQVITVGASGGTYTLTFNGQTTAAIAYNDNGAAIQAHLEALDNIAGSGADVVGTGSSSPYTLTFQTGGAYGNKTPPLVVVDGSNLTGGTVTVAPGAYATGDYYSHVFTLAARNHQHYGSVLHSIDQGGAQFVRKAKDCRFSKLDFMADNNGLFVTGAGLGLNEAVASGAETKTAETAKPILQSTGSFTITTVNSVATGTPRSHAFSVLSPLLEDDYLMHQFGRGDLPVQNVGFSGTLNDLNISYAAYKEMNWGGTSGTGPNETVITAGLSWTFNSGTNYVTGTTPYSLAVAITKASLKMSDFEANGVNFVRYNGEYKMIDDNPAAEPITITLVNGTKHYIGT